MKYKKDIIIVVVAVAVLVGAGLIYKYYSTPNAGSLGGAYPQTVSQTPTVQPGVTPVPRPITPPGTPPPAAVQPSAPSLFSKETVTYTAAGFSPRTLTVKKGDTVTFQNKAAFGFWIYADMYPGVSGVGGSCTKDTFNSCGAIAAGSSWSFTFNVAGHWEYQDRLNPAISGVVDVN